MWRALGVLVLSGCATAPVTTSPDGARQALLAAHAQEREAHVARDADRMAALTPDGFVMVDAGQVTTLSAAQMRARFASYFARVTFDRWDDLEPPRVWISQDGSLGSIAVHKEVVVRDVSDGSVSRTVFAWLETWASTADGWKLRVVASTREPPKE
jgi:hypothetical protein